MKLVVAFLGLLYVVLFVSSARADETQEYVGYIRGVAVHCTITAADGHRKTDTQFLLLNAKDQVQCAEDGQAILQIGCGKAITLTGRHAFLIAKSSDDSCDLERPKQFVEILNRFGAPGGRDRSTGGLIYSPTDQNAVSPGTLVLRWKPLPTRTIWFELRQRQTGADGQRTDATLWKSGQVDGGRGSLDSPELRSALAQLPPTAKAEPLTLWMLGTGSRDQVVRFHLLSAADEHAIAGELEGLKQLPQDPFLQHVARADIFKRYDLYPEAAQEYEAALKVAPNSAPLNARASEIYRLMGDEARANELSQ